MSLGKATTKQRLIPHGRSSRTKKILLAIILLFYVVVQLTLSNHQRIEDYLKLRNYTPSAAIAALAAQDTMTSEARKYFYVNHPQISSKTHFASQCPSGTETTVVLGCYHSDQAGIYLLDVSDPRLQGVEQVTAAHETLHAAYDRLSSSQRKSVDNMLMNFYQHGLNDPTVEAQIADYRKTEPNDVVNEMHSLFGTEVTTLTPQLEQYYSQYFTHRSVIATDYQNYEAAFSSREAIISQDNAELASQKITITAQEADLKNKQSALTAQQAQLQAYRQSLNIPAYNALVPIYNQAISSYNAEVDQVTAEITAYNQLVASLQSEALVVEQLAQSLAGQSTTVHN